MDGERAGAIGSDGAAADPQPSGDGVEDSVAATLQGAGVTLIVAEALEDREAIRMPEPA